jgi:putative endonuclease
MMRKSLMHSKPRMAEIKIYWIYILRCNNGNFYTGYTNDLPRRYQQHLSGTGGKYTQVFKPIEIAGSWQITSTKSVALKIEYQIKQLTKAQKISLIANPSVFYQTFLALLQA